MKTRAKPLRVDSHQHVWSLARGDYGWLTPRLAPIYRDFTLDDLQPELRAAGIDATVLVQAAPTLAETSICSALPAIAAPWFAGSSDGWISAQRMQLRRSNDWPAIRC